MKKLFASLALLVAISAMGAVNQSHESFDCGNRMVIVEDTLQQEVVIVAEKMPEYPGGMKELMKYLSTNVRYPKQCQDTGLQGKVVVQFVVETNGRITNAKVVTKLHPLLDREALRVIYAMPKWTPGMNKGEAVRVRYTLPVIFRQITMPGSQATNRANRQFGNHSSHNWINN